MDALAPFAVGGLLTSYLGRWFCFRSVTAVGSTRTSTLQVSNTPFAALAAWLLLGEALSPTAVAFGLTVVAGLLLNSRRASGTRPRSVGVPRALLAAQVGLAGTVAEPPVGAVGESKG